MNTTFRASSIVRSSVALAAVAAFGLMANAQTSNQPASPAQTPTLNLSLPASLTASDAAFSSSADSQIADVDSSRFDMVHNATSIQPPGRRSGHPRYRGGNTNPDGSNKYAFMAGAGLSQPIGNTYHYLTPSWGFQVGGGRNFDKTLGLLLQFDYDHFGFNGRTLSNQAYVYNTIFGAGAVSGLDGNSHVWSVTLSPVVNLISGEGMGAYVTGGVGFYHKTANFFEPTAGLCYDPVFGGYYQCASNQTIDKYTSNAPGFNGGFGFTYKPSRFSSERLYAEVRYVFVDNSKRAGITAATAAPTAAQQAATNFYPANSNRTSYIPVKFGVRF